MKSRQPASESRYERVDPNKFSKILSQKGNLDELLGPELGSRYYEYRRKWETSADFDERPPFPIHIDFELSHSCNLKCPMCTWSIAEKIPGKEQWMDFELFRKLMEQCESNGLPAVGFDWINEPLIRRDLPEFVSYAHQRGAIESIVHTNGTLLDASMSEELIDAGLTRMMFSLDAVTPEVYEKIRVGADMEKVVQNIHRFLDIRNGKRRHLPLVAANFVVSSINEHELPGFIEYWEPYVDFFSIQQYTNPFGDGDASRGPAFAKSRETVTLFRCQQPWQRLTIRYDGSVLPCCSFYGDQLVMGNVRERSIKEIWDSPQMRDLQESHRRAEYHTIPVCLECAKSTVMKEVELDA